MTNSRIPVYINGRFLFQRLSGVQRFAREVVAALDAELEGTNEAIKSYEWVLVTPHSSPSNLKLRNIELRPVRWGKGHFWDQLVFPLVARTGIAVSLANNGAVLHRRSLTVIHDAMVFRTPDNFSAAYGVFHRALGRLLATRSRIGTVSKFSQCELAEVLGLKCTDIFLVPNGHDHLVRVTPDKTILSRLDVGPKGYFLFVGSLSPNKNLRRLIQAFSSIEAAGYRLVVVGASETSVFRIGSYKPSTKVTFASQLSDEEIAALYTNAAALIFPSLYEGFGIPPLEAMARGCPVLASDIPPVREVCGDTAVYFNPIDVTSITQALRLVVNGSVRFPSVKDNSTNGYAQYRWAHSARRLFAAIDALACEDGR